MDIGIDHDTVLFRIAVPTTTAQTVQVVNFYSTTITIYKK